MVDFRVLKNSKRSSARLGILKTPHGEVETPALVGVATQATVKTLTSEQAQQTGTQLLICNTFHLHLKPGERIVEKAGGLHRFMHWPRPLMTDSGGFQVFSLGFGREMGVNKVAKRTKNREQKTAARTSWVKIRQHGVEFQSPLDGRTLFIGPKESIKIQEALGADIILAFDECPPPGATKKYVIESLERTHRWARESLAAHRSKQALYGIVQGGRFRDLRVKSAKHIASLPFDGFGIGGEFGADKATMGKMLHWVNDELPENKPRHLLGIGYPEDLELIVKAGVDTFDITVPTHMARRGIAYTQAGKLDLRRSAFLTGRKPIDVRCPCSTCRTYSRAYVSHLFRAGELSAFSLTTVHNLTHFNRLVAKLRNRIRQGTL